MLLFFDTSFLQNVMLTAGSGQLIVDAKCSHGKKNLIICLYGRLSVMLNTSSLIEKYGNK